jgi:hypothetical protein
MQSGNSAFLVLARCQHPYRLHTRCYAIDTNNLPDRPGLMFPMAGITRNAQSLYTISYRNHGRMENSKRLAQSDPLYCLPDSHDCELIARTRAHSHNLCSRCRSSILPQTGPFGVQRFDTSRDHQCVGKHSNVQVQAHLHSS